MARAALAVVYARDRDEEVAALRQRVLELERSRDELIWMDRLEQAIADCDGSNNLEYILEKVYDLLVYPIEQQRWGMRPGVTAGGIPQEYGLFLFSRHEHGVRRVEYTLMQELLVAVEDGTRLPLSAVMRRVEARVALPSDSLVRLPASAPYRG